MRSLPPLSREKEKNLDASDTVGSEPARRQLLCNPHVSGRQVASYFERWVGYYFADFGAEAHAAVLEEVAVCLSSAAEVLRSGRVR